MPEALMIVGALGSLLLALILVTTGLTNFLDPWNKKERIFGGIKLTIGVLLLIANLVLLIMTNKDQAAFEMKCLSKGGFAYGRTCYKDGKVVDIDEEGQD